MMAGGRLVRGQLRIGQSQRTQAGQDAVEFDDAGERADPHAIQRAPIDAVLAYEGFFNALRAQLLAQSRSVGFGGEGTSLEVQRFRCRGRRGWRGLLLRRQRAYFDEGRPILEHAEPARGGVGAVSYTHLTLPTSDLV